MFDDEAYDVCYLGKMVTNLEIPGKVTIFGNLFMLPC